MVVNQWQRKHKKSLRAAELRKLDDQAQARDGGDVSYARPRCGVQLSNLPNLRPGYEAGSPSPAIVDTVWIQSFQSNTPLRVLRLFNPHLGAPKASVNPGCAL